MKKILLSVLAICIIVAFYSFDKGTKQTTANVGTQACKTCHSTYYNQWKNTGHAQIHLMPTDFSIRPTLPATINMGASYGNATVTLAKNGSLFEVTLNPATGSPVTYQVQYMYGYNYKQRYLVKVENSYYIVPIQWNMVKYKDNSSGTWATYNPGTWFTSSGALKSIDNTFRKKSYDKNCMGCHVSGTDIVKTINGNDTAWVGTWANSSDTLNVKVGCENCHGSGTTHIAGPSTSNIFGPTAMNAAGLQRQQEVCGQCHFRGSSTNKTYEYPWDEVNNLPYTPGSVLSDYIANWQSFLNVFGGPGVWADLVTPRQHHQQWQDMGISGHSLTQNCYSNCHDPHSGAAGYPHQLKMNAEDNSLCISCHSNFGTVGSPNQAAITLHTKHSYDPTNVSNTGGTSRCVSCHMAKTATTANAYDIAVHNFRVIPPSATLQYYGTTTPTLGMVNSCSVSCHRNPSASAVPTFGIASDATLTNWNQQTDSLLADTLDSWYQQQTWTLSTPINLSEGNYSLEQNYPNPFSQSTTITFTMPNSNFVSLKIYDITGKEVYVLVNERKQAGTYSVNWNGVAANGMNVSNKIFFARLEAGEFTKTIKMLMVR